MALGIKLSLARQDRSSIMLLAFVLFGVLAPTGAVLWFMNEAARSQAESARQRVTEAYRDQLRLVRDLVDSSWKTRAATLDEKTGGNGAAGFLNTLHVSSADGVVLFDAKGVPDYPTIQTAPGHDSTVNNAAWISAEALEARERFTEAAAAFALLAKSEKDSSIAARAAQAQIRCLVRSGHKDDALAAIAKFLAAGPFTRAVDLQGRSIAADEELLMLHLLKRGDRRFKPAVERLAAVLNNYQDSPIPSAQRLFLMDELRALAPELPAFPSYAAEQLSQQFLETRMARLPATGALESTSLAGVWQLALPSRRVIALYRTETVLAVTNRLIHEKSSSPAVTFALAPQGAAGGTEAVPTGVMLPGWQISYSLRDSKAFAETAHRGIYLWVGYLVIAAIAIGGFLIFQSFRRQQRLTRLKTDLVTAVSHELKTPLASMRLLVDSLLEDNSTDPQRTREYLQLISGENARLSRLIDNFLTFSRIERNRQQFAFAKTRPEDIVQSTLFAMRERLQTPGCHVDVDISPDLPALQADEDALVTVLLNLLDNAHKYTPSEKHISLRAYCENNHVVFAVKDNGIGIAPREQKRIFRRFYQVDQRLARETGGCGLGLSIVDFIVHAHGGTVNVQSQPGAGSTFSALLPYPSNVQANLQAHARETSV